MVLKFGMLGMWASHAEGIVQQVVSHPNEFALVGFYDPDPQVVADRRKRWEPKLGGMRVFKDPKDLLSEKLDSVVIEGQMYRNLKMARLALERGLPVLLEKSAGID